MEQQEYNWRGRKKRSSFFIPQSEHFGRWVIMAVLLGVVFHFVLFWAFEKVPIFIRYIEEIAEAESTPSELQVIDIPVKPLEDVPDVKARLEELSEPLELSKEIVELEDILDDVIITPEVLDNLMDIKFEAPAVSGTNIADSFDPVVAPELDLDIPELGRSPELLTNPLKSEVKVDPGTSLADIFDPDEFTREMVKKGAGGLSKNGLLEGFTSLEKMKDLKGNALENAKALIGSDLLFEFAKAELKGSARNSLMAVAYLIDENPEMFCVVNGHTDLIGNAEANDLLSNKRANSVKSWLVESLDISPERIIVVGHGMRQPIVKDGNRSAQAINRRVVIEMKKERPLVVKNPIATPSVETPEEIIPRAQKATEEIPKAVEDIPRAIEAIPRAQPARP